MKKNAITKTLIQWRGIRNWATAAVLLTLLTVGGMVQGQVTNIVYQDNFARTGVLNGTAPDTVNAPGATWFAADAPNINSVLMTDGSEIACTNWVNPTNGFYLNGFLPFVPHVGHVYTLSCKMVGLSGGTQWMAVGFATQAITNNFYAAVNCGAGFTLVRANGSGIQTFYTPGGGSTATVSEAFGATTNLFAVVLDTTTGNANYGWTLRFYTNGVQAETYTIPYGNYPIQYVGIGADGATGYFQQFTLVDAMNREGAPAFSEQPNNRTAQVGQKATFWAGITNDYPSAAYQWMTIAGGVTNAIVGATNASYTTPALDMTYNGLNYSVLVTNVYGATNSAPATLTVVSGPPTVYSATKTANVTNVVVTFSKAVSVATGLNPANYSLNINGAPSGVSIVSANYGAFSNSVILTTSTLDTNAGYYVTVQNVQDLFGNAMSSATVPVLPNGLVLFLRADSGVVYDNSGSAVVQWLDQTTNGNDASQFFGVPTAGGGYLANAVRPTTDIINNGQPTLDFGSSSIHWLQAASSPSLASMVSNTTMYAVAQFYSVGSANDIASKTWGNLPAPFDWDPSSSENIQYGNGFNNSPASGTGNSIIANTPYVLASTLTSPLAGGTTNYNFYLNGNNNGTNVLKAVTGNPAGIYDGGRPLWIGGRWDLVNPRMRGQIAEILLFNTTLSGADRTNVDNYLGAKYFSVGIAANLSAATTSSNGFAVTYTFSASQGSVHGFSFQWQENGTNIPGATGQTYTTPILGPGNNGDTFDVVLTLPNGSTINSTTNTLTVLPAAPYVTAAGIPLWEATSPTNIVVLFDEAVNPTSATNLANYSLNGATVSSAAMGLEPNKVVLTTTQPLAPWNANPGNYSLQVQNVQDLYGQTIATASMPVGLYPSDTALWLESGVGVGIDSANSSYAGVDEWDDQSGNGDDMFQYNGAPVEPLLTTNSNGHGLPTVYFSGTNVEIISKNGYAPSLSSVNNNGNDYPPLKITGDMSVFAVVNFASLAGSTNGEILGKTGSTTTSQPAPYDYYASTGSAVSFLRGNGTNNGAVLSTNGPSLGSPHILAVNESGNFVSHYLDAVNTGTNVLGGFLESSCIDQGQPLCIGQRNDLINRLNGSLSELILIGSAVDSNDLVAIENYLASKYVIPTGSNSNPVITQEPVASTNMDVGATLVVPTVVTGFPLYFQWYDTNNIPQAGQTSANLTIPNIQTSDSYYLVVTNVYGSVTSSVVSVTVHTGLNVSLGPPSEALYVGRPYTFTAQAYGNTPIYYQWYQGSSPIPNATNASYSTVAVLGTNNYSCIVTNPFNGYSSTNAGPVALIGVAEPTNSFSQAVLSAGPIAYWRLNEPSGSTIAYDYVGGYNGTYGTSTTNGLPGVPLPGFSSELGVAMDNTASAPYTNAFINTPGVNLNTNTVTFLCWAYPFATQTNSAGLIFYRVNGTVAGYQFANNNEISYNWNNNPATYDFGSTFTVPAGMWSLVAVTITPSNGVVYVLNANGQNSAVNNVTNASLSLASAGFALGADPQGFTLPSRIFNGEMDEAAIFNYTLSASQLQQLYTAATTATVPVNPNPTNIVFSVANNLLHLNWPADHIGWQLQSQTNKLSVGLTTNWVNVSGTTGTNQVVIPLNLTNGSVFFRLVYP